MRRQIVIEYNVLIINEVFVMSRIIKVRGKCYQPSQRPRLTIIYFIIFIIITIRLVKAG